MDQHPSPDVVAIDGPFVIVRLPEARTASEPAAAEGELVVLDQQEPAAQAAGRSR